MYASHPCLVAASLSRWTKVLSQVMEPEVRRRHSRFATRLRGREHQDPEHRAGRDRT